MKCHLSFFRVGKSAKRGLALLLLELCQFRVEVRMTVGLLCIDVSNIVVSVLSVMYGFKNGMFVCQGTALQNSTWYIFV